MVVSQFHSAVQLRRHSLAESRSPRANQQRDERGRSLFKFLMNKPWKRRSVSTPVINKESMQESHSRAQGAELGEGAGCSIHVVASVLQPQLYYKTVSVTAGTTVDDIITGLVTEYAVSTGDQDPDSFYLMEVSCESCVTACSLPSLPPSLPPLPPSLPQTHDRTQGSYSRVLANADLVEDIRLRWGHDPGYFTLTRRHKCDRVESLLSSSRESKYS